MNGHVSQKNCCPKKNSLNVKLNIKGKLAISEYYNWWFRHKQNLNKKIYCLLYLLHISVVGVVVVVVVEKHEKSF